MAARRAGMPSVQAYFGVDNLEGQAGILIFGKSLDKITLGNHILCDFLPKAGDCHAASRALAARNDNIPMTAKDKNVRFTANALCIKITGWGTQN